MATNYSGERSFSRFKRIENELKGRNIPGDPRQGVAKGCYCRSVGAIHQGSPLILDFKAAFKE